MRVSFLSFLLLLMLPKLCLAQTELLHGRIVDELTNEPLAFASVYYNNTTIGTQSDINGKFSIQYRGPNVELIISYVGYEAINFLITEPFTGKVLVFKLKEKANSMQAFEISAKRSKTWYQNLEVFKEHAIGTSFFAHDCRILNPEVLQFSYDTSTFIMRAHASDILKIEHTAFGFQINYSLSKFEFNVLTHVFEITGYPFFEPLKGSKGQERRWQNNQKRAYDGSLLHFVHAAHQRTLQQEGFELRWVERMLNPNYRVDSRMNAATNALKKMPLNQAIRLDNPYQQTLNQLDQEKFLERVDTSKVDYADFLIKSDSTLQLHFKNYLQVKYLNSNYSWAFNQSGPRVSLIYLTKDRVDLDESGRIIDPSAVLVEGYWASQLLGDLLPFDYVPKKED